jgi:pilus assembly protein CpaE
MSNQAYDPNNPQAAAAPSPLATPAAVDAPMQAAAAEHQQINPQPVDPTSVAPEMMAPPLAPEIAPDPVGAHLDTDHAFAAAAVPDASLYAAATGQENWSAQLDAAPISEELGDIRPVPRVAIQAFCETELVANTIDKVSQDRRMGKAHLKVQMGGIRAAVDFYQTATTPNLILVESQLVGGELMAELEYLAEVCDEGTNVVVIGHKNDVQLYRELISRGVAEYLYAPISMTDVMEVVTTLFVNPEASPLGNSLAFIGAKGGVGSSTVAHNVAWAISNNFQSDVILTDLDLAFGTANIDFDQDPAQGVAEAVFSSDRIDETFLDRLLAKCSDHLSLLAAPSTLDREYDFDANDFEQLLEVAQRGTPNVVIDLPHAWTGWVKQVLASADKVIITATPDLACLRNTKNLVDTLSELRPNDDKPMLVLNQCNVPKRPEISVEDFTQPLGITPTITLPFDPALFGLAANNGQMISETDAKSEISAAFDQLAQVVTGRREIEPVAKKSMGSLLSRFSLKKAKK